MGGSRVFADAGRTVLIWFSKRTKIYASLSTAATPKAPAITPELIAEAKRQQGGGWVYAMDGVTDPNAAVPPERIRGCWKVDKRGEIVGDFIFNPNYRPIIKAT